MLPKILSEPDRWEITAQHERAERDEMPDRWERAVIWETTADLERAACSEVAER
jgi:hypothetical protein